jgi:hypothetical protein
MLLGQNNFYIALYTIPIGEKKYEVFIIPMYNFHFCFTGVSIIFR